MKPHEKLGVAIVNAGYDWTPKMRSAWEELDRQTKPLSDEEIEQIYYKDFNYEDADMVKFARAIEERHGIK